MKNAFDDLGEILSKDLNIRANIVPMIDAGDEDVLLHDDGIEQEMPVLPVLDQVLFPGVLIPIAAQRPKARQLLADVSGTETHILVFAQKTNNEDPDEHDLYPVGVIAKVLKVFNFRTDISVAVLQGIVRCHSLMVTRTAPYMWGCVQHAPESTEGLQTQAFSRKVKLLRKQYAEVMKSRFQDEELGQMLTGIGSDKIFINFAATHMDVEAELKYELLACDTYRSRVDKMLEQLNTLRGLDDLRREIDSKTKEEMERQQREYFLRHQMNVIQEELGANGNANPWGDSEVDELRRRASEKVWPESVAATFEKEMHKLTHIQPMSSDYTVQLNYLETLLDLPWDVTAKQTFDIKEAREQMERDHYGIEKVKQRVVEYLAVLKRQSEKGRLAKAQVLCLVTYQIKLFQLFLKLD